MGVPFESSVTCMNAVVPSNRHPKLVPWHRRNDEEAPLLLRSANDSDIESIQRVQVDCLQKMTSTCYSSEQIQHWVKSLTSQYYADLLKGNGDFLVVVKRYGNDVVAFAHLKPAAYDHVFPVEIDYELHKLYVSPSVCRKGLGRTLLKEIERRVSEQGGQCLGVKSALNAVGFYEACGFSVVKTDCIYKIDEEVNISHSQMVKDISQDDANNL